MQDVLHSPLPLPSYLLRFTLTHHKSFQSKQSAARAAEILRSAVMHAAFLDNCSFYLLLSRNNIKQQKKKPSKLANPLIMIYYHFYQTCIKCFLNEFVRSFKSIWNNMETIFFVTFSCFLRILFKSFKIFNEVMIQSYIMKH